MAEQKNPMELLAERDKIFYDYYTNVVPTRMPVNAAIVPLALAQYAGQDPFKWQYEGTALLEAMEQFAGKIYSDTCPFSPPVLMMRPAYPYQLLKSQSFVLAENGQIQHPEVSGMPAEEYPELIERGFDYLVEKVVPRQHKNLDPADPIKMAYTALMELNMRNSEAAAFFPPFMGFCARMGYHNGGTLGSGGAAEAPMDFLADQLRGFSNMTIDIRRRPEDVKAACEVLTPLMQKMGMPPYVDYQQNIFYPLHMPTFMRPKDVENIYMPSYKKLMRDNTARGIRPYIFVEDDWTNLLDLIHDEFPAGCILAFDEGDPKLFKDKLGDKFLMSGLFPLSYMRNHTTQEIIDKAKEYLDILLPGCGYVFGFDKSLLFAKDADIDQYAALMEFLRDYARYDNVGSKFGTPLNAEGFEPVKEWDGPIKSRYVFNWDEFKAENPWTPDYARGKFAVADNQVFNWYMNWLF